MTTVAITNMNHPSWDVYFNTLLSRACGWMAQPEAQAAKVDETLSSGNRSYNCRTSTSTGDFGEGHCFGFLVLTNKEKMPGETTVFISKAGKHLYRLVVQLGLQLLGIRHLAHGFHEVFLGDVLPVGANGKQACGQIEKKNIKALDCRCEDGETGRRSSERLTCFRADVSQVRAVETVRQLDDRFEI